MMLSGTAGIVRSFTGFSGAPGAGVPRKAAPKACHQLQHRFLRRDGPICSGLREPGQRIILFPASSSAGLPGCSHSAAQAGRTVVPEPPDQLQHEPLRRVPEGNALLPGVKPPGGTSPGALGQEHALPAFRVLRRQRSVQVPRQQVRRIRRGNGFLRVPSVRAAEAAFRLIHILPAFEQLPPVIDAQRPGIARPAVNRPRGPEILRAPVQVLLPQAVGITEACPGGPPVRGGVFRLL